MAQRGVVRRSHWALVLKAQVLRVYPGNIVTHIVWINIFFPTAFGNLHGLFFILSQTAGHSCVHFLLIPFIHIYSLCTYLSLTAWVFFSYFNILSSFGTFSTPHRRRGIHTFLSRHARALRKHPFDDVFFSVFFFPPAEHKSQGHLGNLTTLTIQ